MKRDDIVALAKRKAALKAYRRNPGVDFYEFTEEYLLDFAALVAAAEREACAKVCETVDATTAECPELAKYCADAIRKRGAL